jgi:hypothetical protein
VAHEGRRDGGSIVRHDLVDGLEARLLAQVHERRSGTVLALAAGDRCRDRQDGRSHGQQTTLESMSGTEDPDLAFVLEAFRAFDVREGTLDEYFHRFWLPDGVIEFVDGFPISGLELQIANTYELEDDRIKHLRVYVGHERALKAARAGG